MAELYDKLIQDGRESFVPRSNKTRQFWTKHNARVANSQNAQKETVTIIPATEAEMAELNKVPATSTVKAPTSELDALKKQMELQQELMLAQQRQIQELLNTQKSVVESGTVLLPPQGQHFSAAEMEVKEKVKPGPKPKNNTDGETETKDAAKA